MDVTKITCLCQRACALLGCHVTPVPFPRPSATLPHPRPPCAPPRFERNSKGHAYACNATKPMWCWLPEVGKLLARLQAEEPTRELTRFVSCTTPAGMPDPFPGACRE